MARCRIVVSSRVAGAVEEKEEVLVRGPPSADSLTTLDIKEVSPLRRASTMRNFLMEDSREVPLSCTGLGGLPWGRDDEAGLEPGAVDMVGWWIWEVDRLAEAALTDIREEWPLAEPSSERVSSSFPPPSFRRRRERRPEDLVRLWWLEVGRTSKSSCQ